MLQLSMAWNNPRIFPVFILLSLLTGFFYRRVAKDRGWRAWETLGAGIALAGALAVTLTPPEWDAKERVACLLAPPGRLGLFQLPDLNPDSLNALLLLPFGFLAVLAARRAWPALLPVLLLPVFIELVQALVPALDRTCNLQDAINNLSGGLLGIGLGLAVILAQGRIRPAADPTIRR
jgi:hypothetical protein